MFTLDREVNPAQLDAEIAAAHGWQKPAGVSVRQPGTPDADGTALSGVLRVERDDADAAKVNAAIAAHVADDAYGQPSEDVGLAGVRAKAAQVAAGDGTFTAAQVQKILAHLVLRTTR